MGGWIYEQSQDDTLDMSDGWVGVPKMKYFDITVHGWVSICTVTG